MPTENEVRITLTDVYNEQQKQGKDVAKILGEINTSIAVLTESVKPQTGINGELFKRVLALEKKVWALPSIATLISFGGFIVALLAMNSK